MSRKMKDTGIEWIGEIPDDWEVVRNKEIFKERKEKSLSEDDFDLLAVSEYYGVARKIDTVGDSDFLTRAESLEGYRICKKNDLAMNIMLAWKQAYGVSDYDGIVSPSYAVFSITNAFPKYYHHLLRTSQYSNLFKQYSTGIIDSRLRLYPNVFLSLYSHRPTVQEQQRIANFLDKKVAEIDHILEKTRESIEEYKKYKQSIITEAVTKGLNPDVKMKDSGIEWIGEIPEHWEVTKLKNLCKMKSGTNLTSEEINEEGSYIVYGGNGLRGYYTNFNHDGNYILIGRQGALCGNVQMANGKFWATEHAIVTTNRKNSNLRYLRFLLESMNLNQYSVSAAQPGLAVSQIMNLKTCLTHFLEQEQISDYLDIKSVEIDTLINQKKVLIKDLEAYKKSLVYECVTGKREVV